MPRTSSVRLRDVAAAAGSTAAAGVGAWSGHAIAGLVSGLVLGAVVALGQLLVRLVPVMVASRVALSSKDADAVARIEALTKLVDKLP